MEANLKKVDSCIRVYRTSYVAELKRRKYSPQTIDIADRAVRDLEAFLSAQGVREARQVTPTHLASYHEFIRQRNFAIASQETYLREIKKFFAHLEEVRHIFLSPARDLEIPLSRRLLRPVPTEEEVARLLAQPDVSTPKGLRDRALLEVSYSTGARRAELAGMETDSLDLERGSVRIMGKGSKERVVPLGKQAVVWLKRYLADARPRLLEGQQETPLWVGTRGKGLSAQGIQVLFAHYGREAGISMRISPHALRRACASHMLARGAHPVEIQMLLGHATLGTLGQYLKLTIRELHAAHARSNPGS